MNTLLAKNFNNAEVEEERVLISPMCKYGDKTSDTVLCNAHITTLVEVGGTEYEYDGDIVISLTKVR